MRWEERLCDEGFGPVRAAWLARAARIGEFAADSRHLVLDDAHEQRFVIQQALQIGDGLLKL